MMSSLRWARRHLAALLLLASPAVGGQLLPLVHPCAVDSPWVAEAGATDSHAAHRHGGEATSPASEQTTPHAHEGCTCIGACTAPVALQAPDPVVVAGATLQAVPTTALWSPIDRFDASNRPHDRLPPQTAPPLA